MISDDLTTITLHAVKCVCAYNVVSVKIISLTEFRNVFNSTDRLLNSLTSVGTWMVAVPYPFVVAVGCQFLHGRSDFLS